MRTGTVMEPGEYAVRGGILDLFPPGPHQPRCGSISSATRWRASRRSTPRRSAPTKLVQKLVLMPISEVAFGEAAEKLFRTRYVELFGGATGDDPLYEAVSAGQRYPGQEHWLPLFHDKLETLFDYVPAAASASTIWPTRRSRSASSRSPSTTRRASNALEVAKFGAPPYKPVPPD